jgi:hypothetical protein
VWIKVERNGSDGEMWGNCGSYCDAGCGLALCLPPSGGRSQELFIKKKNKKIIKKNALFPLTKPYFVLYL